MKNLRSRIFSILLQRAILISAFLLAGGVEGFASENTCPPPWMGSEVRGVGCRFSMVSWNGPHSDSTKRAGGRALKVADGVQIIRSGYLPENPAVPFRGNVLFLEGFGDSMLNHQTLLSGLSLAGFRVIGFDYVGQGQSSGTLNQATVAGLAGLAKEVFRWHARKESGQVRPVVMGWSLGGLIAYLMAKNGWAKEVVLISPALAPRLPVRISAEMLSSANLTTLHSDQLRPKSYFDSSAIQFTADFVEQALYSRMGKLSAHVRGLALLAAGQDQFIDAELVQATLRKNAKQFEVEIYPDARHELDNESGAIASAVRQRILEFLENRR